MIVSRKRRKRSNGYTLTSGYVNRAAQKIRDIKRQKEVVSEQVEQMRAQIERSIELEPQKSQKPNAMYWTKAGGTQDALDRLQHKKDFLIVPAPGKKSDKTVETLSSLNTNWNDPSRKVQFGISEKAPKETVATALHTLQDSILSCETIVNALEVALQPVMVPMMMEETAPTATTENEPVRPLLIREILEMATKIKLLDRAITDIFDRVSL